MGFMFMPPTPLFKPPTPRRRMGSGRLRGGSYIGPLPKQEKNSDSDISKGHQNPDKLKKQLNKIKGAKDEDQAATKSDLMTGSLLSTVIEDIKMYADLGNLPQPSGSKLLKVTYSPLDGYKVTPEPETRWIRIKTFFLRIWKRL